eukprot:5338901-Lingulodinium_polyedra.AAC.1
MGTASQQSSAVLLASRHAPLPDELPRQQLSTHHAHNHRTRGWGLSQRRCSRGTPNHSALHAIR